MSQRKLKSGNRIDIGARVLSVDFDDTVAIHPTNAEEFVTMR